MRNLENWFTTNRIDKDTFVISEPDHWEETNCYLLIGTEKALLIDTGLGVSDIFKEVRRITDKPIVAVPSHVHWDHIGGLRFFPEFFVHKAEIEWINGRFPLSIDIVRKQLVKNNTLPVGFNVDSYNIFQNPPFGVVEDCFEIEIGQRKVKILHTPGHSPGHLCFFEKERGYIFTGDLVYKGTLYANYPSTDPVAYLESLEKIAKLPLKRIFPAHHSIDMKTDIIIEMRDELRKLYSDGLLHHGSGRFDFADWSILL